MPRSLSKSSSASSNSISGIGMMMSCAMRSPMPFVILGFPVKAVCDDDWHEAALRLSRRQVARSFREMCVHQFVFIASLWEPHGVAKMKLEPLFDVSFDFHIYSNVFHDVCFIYKYCSCAYACARAPACARTRLPFLLPTLPTFAYMLIISNLVCLQNCLCRQAIASKA